MVIAVTVTISDGEFDVTITVEDGYRPDVLDDLCHRVRALFATVRLDAQAADADDI